ncbi:MAG: hypothetical protein H5T73_04740 [Actinobacteria bacterium]|nr:hypothetical protein [Actinomycetota bacterium]
MSRLLRAAAPALIAALLLLQVQYAGGCGSSPVEPAEGAREAVEASLRALHERAAYRFQLEVQTWIGVSGYTVYGDEKGEGFLEDGEFSLSVLSSSPAGEEILTIFSQEGAVYSKENGETKAIDPGDMPNRLYDPRNFTKVLTEYGDPVSEGVQVDGGATFRVYLLELSSARAQDILSGPAWEYFSNLRFEVRCRVWVGEGSAPPARLVLELVGYDPQESLQRYRSLITLRPEPPT